MKPGNGRSFILGGCTFSLLALLAVGCGSTDTTQLAPFEQPIITNPPDVIPPGLIAFSASGADVTQAVTAFRARLGDPNNGAGAAANTGRREINWDGVPGGVTNNDTFPGNFFNTNSPRGALLSTPGTGLRVSDTNFSDVDPSYAIQFNNFSPIKTFSPSASNVIDVLFNVPGGLTPGGVTGFGAVFSDVDTKGPTTMELFDSSGVLLSVLVAPPRSDASGLSFVAALAPQNRAIARVRITLGTGNLGLGNLDISAGGTQDLVVLDDFLYGEPQPITRRVISGSGRIASDVNAFISALGNPSNGAGAAAASGRRDVNWDGVPGGQTNTNTFPGNFFNANSTRGLVMTTPGSGLRVSDNNFSDVDPSYALQFNVFSALRSFSPIGSNSLDCSFFRAGTATVANIGGFGAVFSDVDVVDASGIQLFNGAASLGTFPALTRSDAAGLSFLGVQFAPGTSVSKVRINLGTGNIGAGTLDISAGGSKDLVILDDFLYSEPQ